MSAAVSTSHMQCWRGSETPLRATAWVELEHDPEKWIPVFRKRSCSNKKIEWDDDSKKSHRALEDEAGGHAPSDPPPYPRLVGAIRIAELPLQIALFPRDDAGIDDPQQ